MIYCIWYPSGGFGHFINAVISIHGKNFYHLSEDLKFSTNGNSHSLPLSIPKYSNRETFVRPFLDPKFNYTVLIDNGINDESTDFSQTFVDCQTIKVCYDDWSWPVVAHTHIVKAMNSSLKDQLQIDCQLWPDTDLWAQREKYFLYLRDHPLRHAWRPSSWCSTLPVASLYDYHAFHEALTLLNLDVQPFQQDWNQWRVANNDYLQPVMVAKDLLRNLHVSDRDLTHINDIWTQAVFYYYLWLEFAREVPHNDYADFFSSTGEIRQWLST